MPAVVFHKGHPKLEPESRWLTRLAVVVPEKWRPARGYARTSAKFMAPPSFRKIRPAASGAPSLAVFRPQLVKTWNAAGPAGRERSDDVSSSDASTLFIGTEAIMPKGDPRSDWRQLRQPHRSRRGQISGELAPARCNGSLQWRVFLASQMNPAAASPTDRSKPPPAHPTSDQRSLEASEGRHTILSGRKPRHPSRDKAARHEVIEHVDAPRA